MRRSALNPAATFFDVQGITGESDGAWAVWVLHLGRQIAINIRIERLADKQGFALAAAGTGETYLKLARVVVELAHQPKAIGMATQTFHFEITEGTVRRGLRCVGRAAEVIIIVPHSAQSVGGGRTRGAKTQEMEDGR